MQLRYIIFVILLFGLGVSFGFGYFLGYKQEHGVLVKKLNELYPIREHDSSYQFIDPLLAYVIPEADQEAELAKLRNGVVDYIASNKNRGIISDTSVFLSSLNRGRWVGADENQKYTPASMLKVVIMVAYLKVSESDSSVLQRYLVYTAEIDGFVRRDASNTPSALKIGNSYKVEDLINKMIVESDNGAEYLLLSNIQEKDLNYIYSILGVENPHGKDSFAISPRTYSLFFRILYSATYLNKENSEKALRILSQTTFNEGLTAGVPQGTIVSHKFGQHIGFQEIELHDCGIVYYPQNPYLICVMTRGKDVEKLKETIQHISSLVYQGYK